MKAEFLPKVLFYFQCSTIYLLLSQLRGNQPMKPFNRYSANLNSTKSNFIKNLSLKFIELITFEAHLVDRVDFLL